MTSSLHFINFLERLTELRETLVFTILLMDMKQQPDVRDTYGEVWEKGTVPPYLSENTTLPNLCSPTMKFSNPVLLDFWGTSLHSHDWHSTPSPSTSPEVSTISFSSPSQILPVVRDLEAFKDRMEREEAMLIGKKIYHCIQILIQIWMPAS